MIEIICKIENTKIDAILNEVYEMKKKLVLLLASLMCISLCACGGSEISSGNNINTETKTNSENSTDTKEDNSEFQRETTEEGYIIISKKEFASYITKVELTSENWKEYIDIVEKTTERKNKFGDVISTNTYTSLTTPNALACFFDDFAIELTIIESGETIYCEDFVGDISAKSPIEWEDYVIDDFVCERIIGDLYILKEIPSECISVDENGTEFICIGSSDNYIKSEFEYLDMDLVMAYNNFGGN